MKRDQFMTELAMGVADLPQDVARDILTDMDEYFNDGLNQGKSEEAICDQLGDVDDFIALLHETEQRRSSSKELSLHTTRVHLSVDAGDIHVHSADHFEIKYDPSAYAYYTTKNERDDVMDIVLESKTKIRGMGGLINSFLNPASTRIDVLLPEDVDQMDIHSDYGDIEIESVHGSTISLSFNKGDIDIKRCEIIDLHVCTSLGDIDIKAGSIQRMDLSTNAGDIDIEGNGSTISAISDLGDIDYEGMVETIDLKTSKGDIDFSGKINQRGHIQTQMGDIDMHINDATIKASTKLGDIDIDGYIENGVYILGDGSGDVTVSSALGDVTVSK